MKTRPERDPKQTAKCNYSILCECGRSYIGETGRLLSLRLRKHRQNQKEDLEKSKLAQHAYEQDHTVGWDEARISEITSKSRCCSHVLFSLYKLSLNSRIVKK
jgi:hypothetical protein